MENFNERLLYIFEKFSLNASTFADKIGVQRSSMSHILSGRNKASLDFILKIYDAFPQINLAWLTLGEGDFSKDSINKPPISFSKNEELIKNETEFFQNHSSIFSENQNEELISNQETDQKNEPLLNQVAFDTNLFKTENSKDEISPGQIVNEPEIENLKMVTEQQITHPISEVKKQNDTSNTIATNSEIEQVMFFYKDGTFKTFRPK